MDQNLCTKQDHDKEAKDIMCIQEDCPLKYNWCCSYCQGEEHPQHKIIKLPKLKEKVSQDIQEVNLEVVKNQLIKIINRAKQVTLEKFTIIEKDIEQRFVVLQNEQNKFQCLKHKMLQTQPATRIQISKPDMELLEQYNNYKQTQEKTLELINLSCENVLNWAKDIQFLQNLNSYLDGRQVEEYPYFKLEVLYKNGKKEGNCSAIINNTLIPCGTYKEGLKIGKWKDFRLVNPEFECIYEVGEYNDKGSRIGCWEILQSIKDQVKKLYNIMQIFSGQSEHTNNTIVGNNELIIIPETLQYQILTKNRENITQIQTFDFNSTPRKRFRQHNSNANRSTGLM